MPKVNFNNLPLSTLSLFLVHNTPLDSINKPLINIWQKIQLQKISNTSLGKLNLGDEYEAQEVDWLIYLFNNIFKHKNVELVRGGCEPVYFPSTQVNSARIEFAHGFFSSALHEISHWCIAGTHRRTLHDFGYWYAPDGRSAAQQHAFERVEIKPQAIECLFTLACGKPFKTSQDNLNATFDTSQSTFETDVYNQAKDYIHSPNTLPSDAKTLLTVFAHLCHDINST